jgi:hypothetical protein
MATLYPVAGCRYYIGGAKVPQTAPFTAADFTAETWVEIGGWTQMGGIGDAAQLITTDVINEGRTKKSKGTRNAGSMQNVFNTDPLDAGQIAAIAAEATINNYAFKLELNDKPAAGPSPTNSMRYFIGLVTQANESGGGANTIQSFNLTVEINSNIVRVAAGPGT